MESKRDIRKRVLNERNLLSKKEWEEKSHSVLKQVTAHPFFLDSEEVYCYIDYKNEVGTRELIEAAWNLNKKVAVPKINGADMEFFYINSMDELQSGYCKILEPVTEIKAQGRNVLVVMPGAAFDRQRNRIGYGKGFYDRYLMEHLSYHTIALAFELQMVGRIPTDEFDMKPEIIITEENTYA